MEEFRDLDDLYEISSLFGNLKIPLMRVIRIVLERDSQ